MPGIIGILLLMAIIAYLWGSIPTGYWMGKILRGKDFDIRDHGSHKTGATNVQRTLGSGPALIVFIVDLSKGIGPTLLAVFVAPFSTNPWSICIAGIAAFLGHCFPVFIGFKGGRGVLTGGGAMLVASPLAFLISAVVTIGTIAISRYVSLGSILGSFASMVCGVVFYIITLNNPAFFAHIDLPRMILIIVVPFLVIIFHRDNIGRLLSGTERKLGQKVSTAPTTSVE
ncbi:MAG TPA: glycerol-3-phosphate 1-O-acyltransferase PlsY [Dictyobacter sp.]|jgi:glycerol-3-phosphate acyltransferase PlsY|nr:glycerol-3-phosphate 1-O-acyltransferase PlsY [Dictyobacter sp.]